jgi:polysaccharide pyruvyl transferase WcaK-like protein
MMVRWVRATGLKVLACPEMTHEVQLAKEELVDPLPDEVKDRVVWRDSYWLPDEAASVYARACAVVSMECHSPIIALAQGTPALYVRQPTDSAKGQMYEEIGLGDWALEIEENSGESLWAKLSSIHYDPVAARERVKRAMTGVAKQQRFMVETARDSLT